MYVNCFSLLKLHFGLSIIISQRVCKRERERIKKGRQAGGFTLLIIKLHKQAKFLHVKDFMGFIGRKYSHSA